MTAPFALALAGALLASEGPLLYEVPRGGPSLEGQRRPVFFAAPFEVRGGRIERGAWLSSEEVLGPGWTRVVVAASWCSACRQLLVRLPAERPRRTVILFLEDENLRLLEQAEPLGRAAKRQSGFPSGAQPERGLADAAALEGYPLPLHLLRADSALARGITHYPFKLVCSRTRCIPERARPGRR